MCLVSSARPLNKPVAGSAADLASAELGAPAARLIAPAATIAAANSIAVTTASFVGVKFGLHILNLRRVSATTPYEIHRLYGQSILKSDDQSRSVS
jgi:hypothetical protein